jgi:hypothetical protein
MGCHVQKLSSNHLRYGTAEKKLLTERAGFRMFIVGMPIRKYPGPGYLSLEDESEKRFIHSCSWKTCKTTCGIRA